MKEIKFKPFLEEYLVDAKLLDEVRELITLSRTNNPKKWDKFDEIEVLNTAFDWELGDRGFEFWEEVHLNFGNFAFKKKLAAIKLSGDFTAYADIMHPTLVKFLIEKDCLGNYITNCITFIQKYSPDLIETPITVEDHLKSVRDLLNAFRFSETPEGKDFWKVINEQFVVWKG